MDTHTKKIWLRIRSGWWVSRWGGVPITAAGASDLGCSHVSQYGQEQPALPFRLLLCPNLYCPSPLEGGQRSLPRRQRGGTVLGEGPGIRPCTGSDSHWTPTTSLREVLCGGWRVDTRGQQCFFFQHQARDRTGETRDNQALEPNHILYPSCRGLPPSQEPSHCNPPFCQGLYTLSPLPVRASWAKYLTSTSWSWVSFSRIGLTSLCRVLESEGEK